MFKSKCMYCIFDLIHYFNGEDKQRLYSEFFFASPPWLQDCL